MFTRLKNFAVKDGRSVAVCSCLASASARSGRIIFGCLVYMMFHCGARRGTIVFNSYLPGAPGILGHPIHCRQQNTCIASSLHMI